MLGLSLSIVVVIGREDGRKGSRKMEGRVAEQGQANTDTLLKLQPLLPLKVHLFEALSSKADVGAGFALAAGGRRGAAGPAGAEQMGTCGQYSRAS